jgi:hypothetical protein
VTLLYLYLGARNAGIFPEFENHRKEVARFTDEVKGSFPSFKAIRYRDLWDEWGASRVATLAMFLGRTLR